MRYLFAVDDNGKCLMGCAVADGDGPPADMNIEGDATVWLNQERAFYDSAAKKWTVYDPIATSTTPNPAAVNAVVELTATLPPDTPDTQVTFALEGWTPVTESVVQGQATHAYAFTAPGTYRVTVSSAHHGSATVEVVVA